MDSELSQNPQFLGGVIHQLRNWLGGIIGQSDLALSSENPIDMTEGLNVALELSLRSTELLSALSSYRNERTGKKGRGDLAQIGREVILLTDNWLKEMGIGVSEKLDPAPSDNVDLALTRLTLLESIYSIIEILPHGESIEFQSGVIDNTSFLGLVSRVDPGKLPKSHPLFEIKNQGLQSKIEIGESGDFRFMIIVPVGA